MTRARDLADIADKDISGTLTLDDIVLSNDMSVADNGKVQFGAGNDLQIYHDGSNSYIQDTATGQLLITTQGSYIALQKNLNETMAQFIADGSVDLYHDNSKKFETTSTGVDVTGTATATTFQANAGGTFTTASGNDLNIVYPDSRSLFIKEGSTTHVTVDNVGNVGIGKSSSITDRLHIEKSGANCLLSVARTSDGAAGRLVMQHTNAVGALQTTGSVPLTFGTNDTERMRINAAGNVGVNVTPSGWSGDNGVVQVGNSSVANFSNGAYFTANSFFDGSNNRYIASDEASRYYQASGIHIWQTAAAGTAGDAVSFSEKMRITSGGNVGINNTSPQAPLHIIDGSGSVSGAAYRTLTPLVLENNGNTELQFFSNSSNDAQIRFGDGDSNFAGAIEYKHGSDAMLFHTAVTERMRINSSGNVGISTSSPVANLEIEDGGTSNSIITKITADDQNPYALMIGNDSYSTTDTNAFGFLQRNDGTAYIYNAGSVRATITSSGDVGIGTTVSSLFNSEGTSARLTVAGSDTSTTTIGNGGAAINIVQTNGTAGNTAGLHFSRQDTDGTPNYSGAAIVAQFPDTQATGQYPKGLLAFNTSTTANAAPSEKMRITSAGLVGIGTSSPEGLIGLPATASNTPKFRLQSASTNTDFAISSYADANGTYVSLGANHYLDSGGNDAVFETTDKSAYVLLDARNNGTVSFGTNSSGVAAERMRINSSGSVTITSGGLQAIGVYNNTTGTGANLVVDSAGGFARSTSSLRYKNTVNDATHGLTELLALRPVTYKGNNDGDTVFGGLVAEEVHDAGLTEFVTYNEDGEPDALAYGNMVSLCIKAIQEQQATITALEARLTALENAE